MNSDQTLKVPRSSVPAAAPTPRGHRHGGAARPVATLLDVQGVGKVYRNGSVETRALHQASVHVASGEMVALMGPSGSGKSTLLNICGLIDTPSEGVVRFVGQDVTHADEDTLTGIRRSGIGFVFQGFNLVPVMTAGENVAYPLWLLGWKAGQIRAAVQRTLTEVRMEGLADRYPDQLSGGQRQRVAIARAIVKRPHLIIADEPTANLDSATAAQVVTLLRELCHSHRVGAMLATHDLGVARECDRVFSVSDGRVT